MSTQRETDDTDGETDSDLSGGYDPEAVEPKWRDHWVDAETYRFGDGDADPDTAYHPAADRLRESPHGPPLRPHAPGLRGPVPPDVRR